MHGHWPTSRLVLLGALVLAGCAQVPQLGALPEPKTVEAYQSSKTISASDAAWPADQWWNDFRDDQLSGLINEALQNAPSLAVAQARLSQALAAAEQAGASLRPGLTADASLGKTKQSYNNGVPEAAVPHGWNTTASAGFNLRYEIDFWGKNRAALAAATSAAEATRADQAQARLTLSTTIASAYAELARLYAERDALEKAVQVRTRTTELFGDRQRNGLETTGSLKQVEARKAAAEAELLAMDEAIALQKNQLAALTGMGPDRALAIARPSLDLARAAGLPANLQADLLGRRPDVVAARLRAQAAAKRIDQARAAFYPNVNLSAFIGFQSLGLDLLTKSGSLAGSVGPAISLPIFDTGRLQGQYKGTRAEYEEAVASYNGAVNQAIKEVADVAVSQRAISGQLGKAQEAVDAATEAYRVAQNRYQGGLATYLEVLSAEDALLSNVRALTNQRSRLFTLDVQLVRALGGGYRNNQA
ncbi:MAG TPA: efflux transporter outer membrane subunit [Noviherbaspirillum sp.]|uniref:efflux transporter outer membrane subunit n=1 Tax=Noviherbaspirillum sp. TaxID=1926288 RepID=UPI002F934581